MSAFDKDLEEMNDIEVKYTLIGVFGMLCLTGLTAMCLGPVALLPAFFTARNFIRWMDEIERSFQRKKK